MTDWAARTDASLLYLSAITVLEFEIGVLQIERRDRKKGAALRAWFEHQVMAEFEDHVLPINAAVARRCAALLCTSPIPKPNETRSSRRRLWSMA